MTSVFDGMAGALNAVFGAPVVFQQVGQSARTIQGVFRREPIEVSGEDGAPIWIMSLSIRFQRSDVVGIRRGDLVQPSVDAGKTYRIINTPDTNSPAADGFLICALEVVP